MNTVSDDPAADHTGGTGTIGTAVFFDGTSNRRRAVALHFKDRLAISTPFEPPLFWAYDDIRRVDSPSGTLRLSCASAPPLARLETRDTATAAELTARCLWLDANAIGRRGVATIIGWSLAAALSLVLVAMFGVPLAADRLAPLMPERLERRIGEVGARQIEAMFGDDFCGEDEAARAALSKLVTAVRNAADVTTLTSAAILNTPVPMRSLCLAARSICSTACCRAQKTRTRSPASSRMNWAISGIVTALATSSTTAERHF